MKYGSRKQIIESCVKNSDLWKKFKHFCLFDNIRLSNSDKKFEKWLLDIGDGKLKTELEEVHNAVKIPINLISNGDLITEVFGDNINVNMEEFVKKIILAPRNEDVIQLNEEILEKINSESKIYFSIDNVETNENEYNYLTTEFLNTLVLNGLPMHKLKLKVGAIVILLTNFNVKEGLCNGTRLMILEMKEFVILAKILSGIQSRKTVLLPRIDLKPNKEDFPIEFIRRQFPIRLGMAMTINRAQGQSFNIVGIHLPISVFSHGQLYVALSRTTNAEKISILLSERSLIRDSNKKKKENYVYESRGR